MRPLAADVWPEPSGLLEWPVAGSRATASVARRPAPPSTSRVGAALAVARPVVLVVLVFAEETSTGLPTVGLSRGRSNVGLVEQNPQVKELPVGCFCQFLDLANALDHGGAIDVSHGRDLS